MFGKLVKRRRSERGWSQQRLADALSMSTSLVSRWENGDVDPPLSKAMEALRLLGATSDDVGAMFEEAACVPSADDDTPVGEPLPFPELAAVGR
jgi:transcriptional regulator with XRE-family HTH domain